MSGRNVILERVHAGQSIFKDEDSFAMFGEPLRDAWNHFESLKDIPGLSVRRLFSDNVEDQVIITLSST
jgi:hypothetical protein